MATGPSLAIHHAPLGPAAPGPGGGTLAVPAALPLAWTSIVPFDLVRSPEADVGALDASLRGAIRLDAGNDVAVGREGLIAEVAAPPGSRVLVSDGASVSRLPVWSRTARIGRDPARCRGGRRRHDAQAGAGWS